MRGPNLLLAHVATLGRLTAPDPPTPRPPARDRLEHELGPELARELLASLVRRPA
jgi:hypothetical protein